MTDLNDDLAVVERVELSDSEDDEFDYAGVEVRALCPNLSSIAHINLYTTSQQSLICRIHHLHRYCTRIGG
jgi:hypothetical protein